MSPLIWIVLRWGIIEVIAVNLIGRFVHPIAIYPASWVVYSLAGWEAARRGKTWHGVLAGGGVALVENVAWFFQGAPGRADTADLPIIIAALTYATLVVGMITIGAGFGAIGAVFGRWARLRSERMREFSGTTLGRG